MYGGAHARFELLEGEMSIAYHQNYNACSWNICIYVAADDLSNLALLEKIKLLEKQLESKVKKDTTNKDVEETSTEEKREGTSKYSRLPRV